jgi:predicted DNA binding protein
MPFFWATGGDFQAFESRVQDHDAVEELAAIDRIEDSTLYRITWVGDRNDIVTGMTAAEGSVLEERGDSEWEFQVRFPDHDRLSSFHNYLTSNDVSVHIDRTYTLTDRTKSIRAFDLTAHQREALLLGLRRGYFDTPSKTSLDDLADELDISQQATSNRIRRGTKKVLDEALLDSAAALE